MTQSTLWKWSAALLPAALIGGALAAAAPANPDPAEGPKGFDLRTALKPMAEAIQQFVAKNSEKSAEWRIAVGEFTGQSRYPSNAGPGIQQALKEELVQLRVVVDAKADLEVKGDYAVSEKPGRDGLMTLQLTARVYQGVKVLVELNKSVMPEVRDTAGIAVLLGATAALPPGAAQADRNAALKRQLDKTPFIDGNRIRSQKERPYAVEILAGPQSGAPSQSRQPRLGDGKNGPVEGQPYVDVQPEEIYQLKLYNNSDYDAAAAVTIDGIDLFAFADKDAKTGRPPYQYVLVPAHETRTVEGFPKNLKRSYAFLVKQYGDGLESLAPVRVPGKIGTLTVVFAAAWTDKDKPPPDEAARGVNLTVPGPLVDVTYEEVQRFVGTPRDVITVRYTR